MDLATLRTRVETRAQDASNHVFTEAEIDAYINDAYMEAVAYHPDWPFLESRRTQVTVSAGASVGDLPADTWRVGVVFNATDGYTLSPISGRAEARRLFPDSSATGQITHYRLLGSKIEVYPTPAAETVLEVDAFTPPAELTTGTEPIFPEQYHRILVNGALAELYDDDGNHAAADRHRLRFEQSLQRMAHDLLGARNEGYPQIVDDWY